MVRSVAPVRHREKLTLALRAAAVDTALRRTSPAEIPVPRAPRPNLLRRRSEGCRTHGRGMRHERQLVSVTNRRKRHPLLLFASPENRLRFHT